MALVKHSATGAADHMRPLMLKDYLKYDAGSCSSSGFRSFPRRECCISVLNLIEFEATRKRTGYYFSSSAKRLITNRSKSSSSSSAVISKLERASIEIIKAVKLLTFKSTEGATAVVGGQRKYMQITRSVSRKLFRRSLLRWRSGKGECKEEEEEEDVKWSTSPEDGGVDVAEGEACRRRLSSSESTMTGTPATRSNNSEELYVWSDIGELNSSSSCLQFTGGGEEECSPPGKKVGEIVGGDSVDHDAAAAAVARKENCSNDQHKEQFSPVSVFDFSDDHEEDGTSSPFTCCLGAHFEGTKRKLVQKLVRCSYLSQVEPVNLENRISPRSAVDHESPKVSEQWCPPPDNEESISPRNQQGKDAIVTNQQKAKHLVKLVKEKVPPSKYSTFNPDNLLLDFFKDRIDGRLETSLLKVAEDWLNGLKNELFLGWEAKHKREAYVREMEEGRRWRTDDGEKEEIATGLAAEVLDSLADELLLELCARPWVGRANA